MPNNNSEDRIFTLPAGEALFDFLDKQGVCVERAGHSYKPLYHLSINDNEGVWTPTVPFTSAEDPESPEWHHESTSEFPAPRICVAPSIEECWASIRETFEPHFTKTGDKDIELFIYQAALQPATRLVDADTLSYCCMVTDAHETNEHWLLDPVFMKKLGSAKFVY